MRRQARHRRVIAFQVNDIARILGVSRNTITRWIQSGILDPSPDGLAVFLRTYTDWRGRLPT